MSVLPKDDKQRKMLPIFRLVSHYFPKALREVTRVAVANNVRYNPGKAPNDINWARGKSTDQMGSLFRHMLEYDVDGLVFEELPPEVQAACGPGFERVYVLAEAAWRALAALELCIEEQESLAVANTDQSGIRLCRYVGEISPRIGCSCSNCEYSRLQAATGV